MQYVDNLDQTGLFSDKVFMHYLDCNKFFHFFFFYKHNYVLTKVSHLTVEFLARKLFSHDEH
jgi:hypothetical protein